MRHTPHLPTRLLVFAALAGSASLAAVAIPAGVASAVTPETVSCTTVYGSPSSLAFSGCTGTGANASNAGTPPAKGTYTNSTKTLKWTTGKTSLLAFKYTKDTTSKCVAIKGDKSLGEYAATGSVTGGTALQMKGGATSGSACIYQNTTTKAIIVKNLGPFKV
jgi:hypothetical protein